MGNVVMPKNSADLDVLIPILKYYYEQNEWVENSDYIKYIKNYLLDVGIDNKVREPQHYTKRMQVLSYFGFIEFEDFENSQTKRRITVLGKKFYEAIKNENQEEINKILLESLEKTVFGRNNCGAPSSDSDVDAPILCIRAIMDLKYINKNEFAYLLYKVQDNGFTYSTIISEIKAARNGILQQLQLPEEAQKYTDWKPINFLERFNFLKTENSKTTISEDVLQKYKKQLLNLKIYNIDKNIIMEDAKMPETKPFTELNYKPLKKEDKIKSYNRIIFGAPGTGKSFQLKTESQPKDSSFPFANIERVTFHPDYSYGQFVGSYKPISDDDGKIRYEYVPGPFMRTLVKALESGKNGDSAEKFLLIVEEINRAKVASVFGDMFQLLDRTDDGESMYEIQASEDVRRYLAKELGGTKDNYTSIKIPNNMYIWATMNSADQGVFPMDTAFKRRWEFEYIGIDENAEKLVYDDGKPILLPIPSKSGKETKDGITYDLIEWNKFRTEINRKLSENTSVNEDKLLGPFFISLDKLRSAKDNPSDFIKCIKSKILMYLFEDVVKISPAKLFKNCGEHPKYSDICSGFDEIGAEIFGISQESIITPTETANDEQA